MQFLYFLVEFVLEFLLTIFVYVIVSYLQNKWSKEKTKKFSIQQTFSEGRIICLIIAIVIVSMNHIVD